MRPVRSPTHNGADVSYLALRDILYYTGTDCYCAEARNFVGQLSHNILRDRQTDRQRDKRMTCVQYTQPRQ